jgi:adenosylcobinamide-GDP ribazoletransferase
VSGLAAAVSFLTRVPVRGARTEEDLGAAVPWFPVVGALVGLAIAGIYAAGLLVLPALPAAALATTAGALATGAFHEDGLADTADAFGSRATGAEAIRILRDPRLGTYGVLALVFVTLVRVAALAALSGTIALAAVPGAHALSRGGVVAVLLLVRAADGEGLGASYRRRVRRGPAVAGVMVALLLGAATLGWWIGAAVIAVALGAVVLAWLAKRRIGGITGDVLGAVQQIGECAVLMIAAAGGAAWWV